MTQTNHEHKTRESNPYRSDGSRWCARTLAVGLVGLTIVVAGAAPSSAAVLTVLNDNGNFVDLFPGPDAADFDVFWQNLEPVWIQVDLGQNDLTPLAFSGIHINETFIPWRAFEVELEGAVFAEVNAVDPFPASIDGGVGTSATTLNFAPAIPDLDILEIGLANGAVDAGVDWFIDPDGDTFSIHLQPVPEPTTLGLFGVALLGAGVVARRRRDRS